MLFLFFREIYASESSAKQSIHIKIQILFSLKEKKYLKISSVAIVIGTGFNLLRKTKLCL